MKKERETAHLEILVNLRDRYSYKYHPLFVQLPHYYIPLSSFVLVYCTRLNTNIQRSCTRLDILSRISTRDL